MGALEDKLNAILDGIRNSSSMGLGDELSPEISTMLPGPKDPEGTSRQYAAGSAEEDMRNSMRDKSTDLERRFPKSYGSGQALGAAPLLAALPELGIAGGGLLGGMLGAVKGAGDSNGEDTVKSAARQAGVDALGGMLGGAVPKVASGARGSMKDLLGEAPQLATTEVKAIPHGVQVSQSRAATMLPPRGSALDMGEMPAIPKGGRTISESEIPALEDLAQAGDDFTSGINKKEIERSLKKQAQRTSPINRDVEYIKNFADQKEAGVAARAKEGTPAFEEESKSAVTVKPPRGRPVRATKETVSGAGKPTIQKTVAEGVDNPDDITKYFDR